MDSYQRQRSHTTSEDDQSSTKEHRKSHNSFSKEITPNNRMSLPSGTPTPVNSPTGKSWMKFFANQPSKPISSGALNSSSEPDITYITPRLIVMTTVRENFSDLSSRSTVESIQNLFDTKHPNSYMIYTLDQSSNEQLSYQKELFDKRVVDLPLFDEKQSPRLVVLLWFCQKITSYLFESPSNIVVLHCIDERNQLAFGACSLLGYHRIFSRVDQILQYYQSKRCENIFLTMSQKRYIQYLCDLAFDMIERPHFQQLTIKTIQLSPVPLVNRQKTGCRPFVDIYDQDSKKIFSTHQETAKLKVYSAADTYCLIPINLPFHDDLTIHITHATINHSRRTHEGGVRICELTINPNFSRLNHLELSYLRNELDGIDFNEKNPKLFRLTIELLNSSKEILDQQDLFLEQLDKTLKQPRTLFGDENEYQKAINNNSSEKPSTVLKSPKFDDKNDFSLSSVIHRQRKSKDESISPQTTLNRLSSFVNPRNTFSQETNERVSQISTPSFIEQNSNQDQTTIPSLLDFGEEDFRNESVTQQSNPTLGSHTDAFTWDTQNDSTQVLSPTTISIQEQKSSTSNITPNTPNYNINMAVKNSPFSQSSPVTSPIEKSKIDIDECFARICDLGNDSKRQSVPNTIGAARNAALAKDLDPTVFKIRQWTEGKKGNIRALLCSLSNITWPECTWTGCQMNQLLTDEQVKKVYRKAVLHIHPDKLRGDPNESLAKLIFVELNEAWSHFEQRN